MEGGWLFIPETLSTLASKTVAIIGVGALGSVVSQHLVRIGVRELRLIDRDIVEKSNLQRQVLFTEEDARREVPKATAAHERLKMINPQVNLCSTVQDVNPLTIESIVKGSDLIIDGTDNLTTRFLINDVSYKWGIPWIYGGAIASRGMVAPFIPGQTPCYRCLFDQPTEQHAQTCDTIGVLGPLVHLVAAHQVMFACQLLTVPSSDSVNSLRYMDVWNHAIDSLPRVANPNCPCCRYKEYQFLESKQNELLVVNLCGRDSVQVSPQRTVNISLDEWRKRWGNLGDVKQTPYYLKLDYDPYQLILFQDGRLMINGLNNLDQAKALYAKLIGA